MLWSMLCEWEHITNFKWGDVNLTVKVEIPLMASPLCNFKYLCISIFSLSQMKGPLHSEWYFYFTFCALVHISHVRKK